MGWSGTKALPAATWQVPAGSKAGGKAGGKAGSEAGSEAGSKAGSKAGSRAKGNKRTDRESCQTASIGHSVPAHTGGYVIAAAGGCAGARTDRGRRRSNDEQTEGQAGGREHANVDADSCRIDQRHVHGPSLRAKAGSHGLLCSAKPETRHHSLRTEWRLLVDPPRKTGPADSHPAATGVWSSLVLCVLSMLRAARCVLCAAAPGRATRMLRSRQLTGNTATTRPPPLAMSRRFGSAGGGFRNAHKARSTQWRD